ncbi:MULTISPECIES: hypothetical protein [Mesorhizobium]|uniref:hypothetical protein n=1 Tax=Mesorhizobium sp. AA23 TaxID=1854058 RepID=UPI0007FBF9CE|nr:MULTISPECIES: hypothetical protein [Mesorhizobium]OBQ94254.1 hypothetical protein A9K66_27770 [Mesorhizobium sp. AA23]
MAASERTKSQRLIATSIAVAVAIMCGDANARHYGRQAVSAELLKMVPQGVPNRAESEWNVRLLR